jgi:hypothetical protein
MHISTFHSRNTGVGSLEISSHHIHLGKLGAGFLNYHSEGRS